MSCKWLSACITHNTNNHMDVVLIAGTPIEEPPIGMAIHGNRVNSARVDGRFPLTIAHAFVVLVYRAPFGAPVLSVEMITTDREQADQTVVNLTAMDDVTAAQFLPCRIDWDIETSDGDFQLAQLN